MSAEDSGSKASVDLSEEIYAPAPGYSEPEHTEVHRRLSRPMELVSISLVLVVWGAILWVHVRERRYGRPLAVGAEAAVPDWRQREPEGSKPIPRRVRGD